MAALQTETNGSGLFQLLGADGVRPCKSGDEAGFPGDEAEQEKVFESEEGKRIGEPFFVERSRLRISLRALLEGPRFPLDADPRQRLGIGGIEPCRAR